MQQLQGDSMKIPMVEKGYYWDSLEFDIPDDVLKKIVTDEASKGKDVEEIAYTLKDFIKDNKWEYDYDCVDGDRNMDYVEFEDGVTDMLETYVENAISSGLTIGEL